MRISLAGGGTDLPEFYEKHGGLWVSGAINKFVYVAVKDRFEAENRLSYSKLELVKSSSDIEHPIFREAFNEFDIENYVEIVTFSDIPARTGLGSSGAFTVGLLNALSIFTRKPVENLAELAYDIERRRLGRPVGKQDQYASLLGGTRLYWADKKGTIGNRKLTLASLSSHLSLFYTYIKRDSTSILEKVSQSDKQMSKIKDIGEKSIEALRLGEYTTYGKLLHEHWGIKKEISPLMSSKFIDKCYAKARQADALGGKLIGAGGGGFLLLYSDSDKDQFKVDKEMNRMGLKKTPFDFYPDGSKVIEI